MGISEFESLANKRIFLTGHTGFKGSWLSLWLQRIGCALRGFSLAPESSENLFNIAQVDDEMDSKIGDIRDSENLTLSMVEFDPDVIIHLAAQPLVRRSYVDPLETYTTNVIGTLNVLEAARKCDNVEAILVVTTDKCYKNNEWVWGYKEIDELGGHDPYSSSKACCELVVQSYRNSFFYSKEAPSIATARAGNVIGGGDWSADRLLPDIISSFQKNEQVVIRNPQSVRPWQHVLEPLCGYLTLVEALLRNKKKYSGSWNFGPNDQDCKSVEWIIEYLTKKWGDGVSWNKDSKSNPHEANLLKLDCSKAKSILGWEPIYDIERALNSTIEWNKKYSDGESMKDVCLGEIESYTNSLKR